MLEDNEDLPFSIPESPCVKSKKSSKVVTDAGMKANRNRNTELCVDVKTFLRTDRRPVINKVYTGTLVRDGEDHFTFVEAKGL